MVKVWGVSQDSPVISNCQVLASMLSTAGGMPLLRTNMCLAGVMSSSRR